MKTIKRLPEIIANKIAAGEVVERPVSVVKELLENAIDANSSHIRIDIEKGGAQLIRISDNGIGMHRDNALLSLERHATSKIATDADLFSIKTLGFRGEALPSIAAISKMVMVTRPHDCDLGTEIQVEGGTVTQVSDAGAPSGTFISVKDLFYNTPARKKYMKSNRTETAHIIDYLSNVAVGFPSIHFKLFHNAKTVKNWPQTKNIPDRIANVMGDDLYKKLYPIEYKNDHVSIEGYVASPETSRKTSSHVIFVNGRVVTDRFIHHAIMEGYRGKLLKGHYPVVVLFLSVPFEDVDVNVHPAKQTVRFVHQGSIYQAIVQAIQNEIVKTNRGPWHSQPETQSAPEPSHNNIEQPNKKALPQNQLYEMPDQTQSTQNKVSEEFFPVAYTSQTKLLSEPKEKQFHPGNSIEYDRLQIIGQWQKTYIICEDAQSMFLIDQHAAHERIVYERLKNALSSQKLPVQHLLISETIELTYQQALIFEKLIPDMQKIGFDIEHFGQNTFVIKSVPDILTGKDIKALMHEIAEGLPDIKNTAPVEQAIDECLMMMACHSAIRAGQTLKTIEIRNLLKSLDKCDHPSQCPHGRPTCVQWDGTEIEKKFKRIV
jgi:DNA mismatch repair protein MutL